MTSVLTKGKPLPLILKYSLPIIAGQLFQLFYTLADTLIVGQTLGANALAAVGATGTVTYFQLVFIQGFTNGLGIVTAQRYGQGDVGKVRSSVAASNLLGLYLTILFTAVFCTVTSYVPSVMGIPDEIRSEAVTYMFIIFAGTVTTVFYNVIANILRALGDSRTPLLALVFSSLLNIGLDLLFILAFGWGVAGAALATVISQGISAAASYIYTFTHFPELQNLSLNEYKLAHLDLGKHLRMALPMGLQMSVMSIGQLVMQSAVNSFGTDIIAGYTAAAKVDQLACLVNTGFQAATAGYVAQNYGAGEYKRILDGAHATLLITEVSNLFMGALMFILTPMIPYFFLSEVNPEIAEGVRVYVLAIVPFYFLLGALVVYRTGLQAVGNNLLPFLACIAELVGRITAAVLFRMWLGYFGVCFANSFAWIGAVAIVLPGFYLYMKKRIKPLLEKQAA